MRVLRLALLGLWICAVPHAAAAGASRHQTMDIARLGQILSALDPHVVRQGNGWRMQIGERVVLVTADARVGRMRAMIPIRGAGRLGADDLRRMLQANFDSALDGRYAIAQGIVWSIFVHPLEGLDKDHLIAGLAQTVTLARTYGTLYSGGSVQFGGGDSPDLHRRLLDDLTKRGEKL